MTNLTRLFAWQPYCKNSILPTQLDRLPYCHRIKRLCSTIESLVRGRDCYGHFRPEPVWASDFATEALAFQEELAALKHAVYDEA